MYKRQITSWSSRFTIDKDGNVGIGTAPNSKLHVTGQGEFESVHDANIILRGTNSWSGIQFSDVNGTDYVFYNGTNSTFAIGGAGSNVSGKKLHIDGGTTIGANYDASTVASNGLSVEGNVGIGTVSPQQKLEVRGGITAEADSYTKLLIHSDTTDNSTTFIDSGSTGHAVAAVNNASHQDTEKKFGNTSIYLDGTDDHLSVADSNDWNFGAPSGNTNDFTIDFWWKDDGSADGDGIISIGHNATNNSYESILVYKSGTNLLLYSSCLLYTSPSPRD